MGFLGGLFGGGDASGSGIGNSTTKQTTTYNEKYANVADYARYSHVGSVVDLKGVVGKNTINISMLDGGAIGRAFDFASGVAGLEAGVVNASGIREADLAKYSIAQMGASNRNAIAHVDQTGEKIQGVVTMGVVTVGGILLMLWMVGGK